MMKSPPKLKLSTIISQLLNRAELNPGKKFEAKLKRGLLVEIKMAEGETHLQVSRIDIFPSMKEWHTVCKAFPYKCHINYPQELTHDKKHCLNSKWPTQPRLFSGP